MQVSSILDNIDMGGLALPVFQRGYVWTRPQVKSLMNSLYRGYPVGSLLTWTTRAEAAEVRSTGESRTSGAIDLLLDGQQRLTSLYGIIRGKPPAFFDGDTKAFLNLYFNLENEEFEYYSATRMRDNPLWVNVTDLFVNESGWMNQLVGNPEYGKDLSVHLQRGLAVTNIRNTDLHIESITGDDKTTDIVVSIFNRINSGGTKLSKGDLALARIGAHWSEARGEMQQRLKKWTDAGFGGSLDWLLRCMTAVATNSSEYETLENVDVGDIRRCLDQTENAVDQLLEAMRTHLFMDIDRVFNSKQAFPVMVKFLVNCGGQFPDQTTMAKLLHWYLSVAIWGRFSGPVETVMNEDLAGLQTADPIDQLQRNLRRSQGDRVISSDNFNMNYTRARFYPLLYVMSRVMDARDWNTGNRLRHHSLGDHTNLEVHHIFPRAYLRRNGISADLTNNIGNLAFQTRETNRAIGSNPPVEYMTEIVQRWPGALESQCVPTNPELWRVENYQQFLEARNGLLADAANEMLASLSNGVIPPAVEVVASGHPKGSVAPDRINSEDEGAILSELIEFALGQGLSAGQIAYEVLDSETQELAAVLDLAWPQGLQTEYSQPVAVLIDEDDTVRHAAVEAGFRVFTSPDRFLQYVKHEILGEAA